MLSGVKDSEGNPYLRQGKQTPPRGGIRQLDDGRYIVALFKKKDASTVIHETGHFFLENLREAAALESAPAWVKDAWGTLQKQYGFDGTAKGEAWRAVHERFAREFEAYTREGVAPSPELAGAFEQFKAWLTDVYKSVKRLLGKDKELSPEVREVFDNLLVTEHENIRKTAPEGRTSIVLISCYFALPASCPKRSARVYYTDGKNSGSRHRQYAAHG
jgi:hypothetical protein